MDSDYIRLICKKEMNNTNKFNLGYRLGSRKKLYDKKRLICDYAFILALVGIFLMVLETELTINNAYDKSSYYSFTLKYFISFSTFGLLIFIMYYHIIDMKVIFS